MGMFAGQLCERMGVRGKGSHGSTGRDWLHWVVLVLLRCLKLFSWDMDTEIQTFMGYGSR